MLTALGALAVAASLTTVPVCPPRVAALAPIPWLAGYQATLRQHADDRPLAHRLLVGLGAALAWDAADLPRHQTPSMSPAGRFEPGALFNAGRFCGPALSEHPGGAIGASIDRWNALYPPFALEGITDR